jgi:hypothetical protein
MQTVEAALMALIALHNGHLTQILGVNRVRVLDLML